MRSGARLREEILSCRARWSREPRTGGRTLGAPFVASLTSFGKRLELAHIAIESLMRQSLQPLHLILWIPEDVRPEHLSPALRNQMKRGLEIRPVPDLGPFTKIIPSLEAYPDLPVVTVDDDSIYGRDLFSRLYQAYGREPEHIHCYRAHEMRYDSEGWPRPYRSWEMRCQDGHEPSDDLFPTGVGGVIYPPESLHPEVTNIAAFRELCPKADDVWLKAMALLRGTRAKRLSGPQVEFPLVIRGQKVSLNHSNVNGGDNDRQIRKVFEHYGLNRRMRESGDHAGRKVTIVIPVYADRPSLEQCMESLSGIRTGGARLHEENDQA